MHNNPLINTKTFLLQWSVKRNGKENVDQKIKAFILNGILGKRQMKGKVEIFGYVEREGGWDLNDYLFTVTSKSQIEQIFLFLAV